MSEIFRPVVVAKEVCVTPAGDRQFTLQPQDPSQLPKLISICKGCILNGGNEGAQIVCSGATHSFQFSPNPTLPRLLTRGNTLGDVTERERHHHIIGKTFAHARERAACMLESAPTHSPTSSKENLNTTIYNGKIQKNVESCHPYNGDLSFF
jgi:hypothetical protein